MGDLGAAGEQWTREASQDANRRFSVDASGGSGLPLHLQGAARMLDGPIMQMEVGEVVIIGYRGVCRAMCLFWGKFACKGMCRPLHARPAYAAVHDPLPV